MSDRKKRIPNLDWDDVHCFVALAVTARWLQRRERCEVRDGVEWSVGGDAYYNLMGALYDLERGEKVDKTGSIRTIRRVLQQLGAASEVLQKAGIR
jgi:hypothetical protein